MKEEWRDIQGYEGYYQVSDEGRVKGVFRRDNRGRLREERILAPIKHTKGYLSVHLHINGGCKTVKIHRLVAAAFLPEFCEEKQVDHINGDRSCNKLENLRMASNSENKANMKKISGTSSSYKGVHWHKDSQKWCAAAKKASKGVHIGLFSAEREAALAYDKKAIELFGEYANTNKSMGLLDGTLG